MSTESKINAWVGFFLQYQLIGLRPSLAAGLHTVNALLIFWLTLQMVNEGRKAGTWAQARTRRSSGSNQPYP